MHPHQRHRQATHITLLGLAINLCLAIIKTVFGVIGRSHALVADGLHSMADLLTDILILIAAKYGSRHADYNHPYGHQRIETAATVALALLLIVTGGFIIYDAAVNFYFKNYAKPEALVLWIALGSVIANEIMFRLTKKVGEKIASNLIIANAWHHRSDAAASLVVLLGIIGALAGYPYFDAAAALIVGIMIIKMGIKLGWSSLQELVDTGLDDTALAKMRAIIAAVPGVSAIHQLRTRNMGSAVLVDVHIQVTALLSVSEGHFIAQQVHLMLMQSMSNITDVTVHVDPEDDQLSMPSSQLPARKKITGLLYQHWQTIPESKLIQALVLHYLSGKLRVEIKLPLTAINSAETAQNLQQRFATAVKDIPQVETVKVWFG